MHTYYSTEKHCRVCNHPHDTVSHILNGCTRFYLHYQKRHNRIVDIIYEKIKSANKYCKIFKDSIIKPSMFCTENVFNAQNDNSFLTEGTRPDIVTIDDEAKKVIITEISVSFDTFMGECFQGKFDKYFPLALEINALGYHTEIIVLVIGSLGHVHSKFVSGLRKNNINSSQSTYLAKFCSVSAMMGSFFVWKNRCKVSPRTYH